MTRGARGLSASTTALAAAALCALAASCSAAHGSAAVVLGSNGARAADPAESFSVAESTPLASAAAAPSIKGRGAPLGNGRAATAGKASAVGNDGAAGAAQSPGKKVQEAVAASLFWAQSGRDVDEAVATLLASMGPEQRLGQLFMMSYEGDEPTQLLHAWIKKRGLGGVKIFGWNTDSTARLAKAISAIQADASSSSLGVPPFIATDQEGGWIRHVKGGTSVTPGNMAIGASAWPSDAYWSAYYIGLELAALGINMNFAPTVDLATRPESAIIGPRAFSSDPSETGILAAAWVKGMEDAGVVAMAKHYPGHGDTALDSHGVLPVIDIDEATLWNRELVPYRLLAAEGLPGVMTGHLAFPKITGSREPASLSPKLVQGMLRDRIGFDGLVITDDLLMAGAYSPGGLPETAERAIRAGTDILMFSATLPLYDAAWERLLSLYAKDPSFRARVDESTARVLRAKVRWLLPKGLAGIGPNESPDAALRTAASRRFFLDQAARSATRFGLPGTLPAAGARIAAAGPFPDFIDEARRRLPGASFFRFSYQPEAAPVEAELAAWKRQLAKADAAVVCVANPAGAAFARAAEDAGKRLYIVSALNPTHSFEFRDYATVVAVYSYAKESFKAAFAVLAGDIEAPGRLPIKAIR